jgi:small subunit ribosomal protein S24e
LRIDIQNKKENPLQERTEVWFTVDHKGEATPQREVLAKELANILNVDRSKIIIDKVDSLYGQNVSQGYAKVYLNVDAAKKIEAEYLLKRNGQMEGE